MKHAMSMAGTSDWIGNALNSSMAVCLCTQQWLTPLFFVIGRNIMALEHSCINVVVGLAMT